MKTFAVRRCLAMAVAAATGLLTAGCGVVEHREEHSLVLRRPAHRYRPYTDADVQAIRIVHEADRAERPLPPNEPEGAAGSTETLDPPSASELIRSEPQLGGPLDAFQPFAYCYLHQTCHAPESAVAVITAPVQYSVAAGATISVVMVKATLQSVASFWELILPPSPPPERPAPAPDLRRRD